MQEEDKEGNGILKGWAGGKKRSWQTSRFLLHEEIGRSQSGRSPPLSKRPALITMWKAVLLTCLLLVSALPQCTLGLKEDQKDALLKIGLALGVTIADQNDPCADSLEQIVCVNDTVTELYVLFMRTGDSSSPAKAYSETPIAPFKRVLVWPSTYANTSLCFAFFIYMLPSFLPSGIGERSVHLEPFQLNFRSSST